MLKKIITSLLTLTLCLTLTPTNVFAEEINLSQKQFSYELVKNLETEKDLVSFSNKIKYLPTSELQNMIDDIQLQNLIVDDNSKYISNIDSEKIKLKAACVVAAEIAKRAGYPLADTLVNNWGYLNQNAGVLEVIEITIKVNV